MTSAAPTANQAEPPPAIQEPVASSPPSKRDLRSWWKNFKSQPKHQQEPPVEQKPKGIFGVPLRQSITYANVAISLIDENGQSYIYGYVPIVVAKCGVFLKETATTVPGIFRLSGSEKRIKELKTTFDSPDRYGKGLDWEGYNVHDAANVLRRYLNDLPEPVVPLDLYEKFRDPLRGATKQAVGDAEGPQFVDNFDEKDAIEKYQHLITELPPLNRQLLLYILDLLAVFAAKSDENLMTSHNLAAIFQPGMLSHPSHAMAPEEYRLNQCVLIFLIENQDHFLIGMQGTAADEKTKNDIERGTPVIAAPSTPGGTRKSGIGRSASNASAGADSVRREGKIRRHRSVSSRNSKHDGDVTPSSPGQIPTPSSGGLGRSNTVPSKKSPALIGGKFKNATPGSHSPAYLEPVPPPTVEEVTTPPAEQSGPPPVAGGTALGAVSNPTASGRSQERLLDVPQEGTSTPTKERGNLAGIFQRSPTDSQDKRQPRKLQKKKVPGSLNPSAQSSTASLGQQHGAVSPAHELTSSPLDHVQPVATIEEQPQQTPAQQVVTAPAPPSDQSAELTPRASQVPPNNSLHPDAVLRGKKSPPTSLHSSFNEGSERGPTVEDPSAAAASTEAEEKEKKKRWTLSRRKDDGGSPEVAPTREIGLNQAADISSTSIGSAANKPRKSFTNESSDPTLSGNEGQSGQEGGREGKDESKGLFGRIREKYREAKERTKSPPASDGHGPTLLTRGKSIDIKRDTPGEEQSKAAPTSVPPPAPQPAASQEAPPAASPPTASAAAVTRATADATETEVPKQ
ncbi:rhoGAP domain-containing protein [Sarocladium implicatum]|nr:rhoGAP domain-containing protein [Sarocladium implicatum]